MSDILPAEPEFVATLTAAGFEPVVDDCSGCGHVRAHGGASFCRTYRNPSAKWSIGMCNFATHRRIEKTAEARSLNPLKASKRGGN
ncbi:MAG: hypothetical protein RIT45_2524 [Pseudomonadota bacterium]|jgi:hypothetical protein